MNNVAQKAAIGTPLPRLGQLGKHALLLVVTAAMIMPFVWMVATSFKPNAEVLLWPPRMLPQEPTVAAYVTVLSKASFLRYFANSVLISSVSTILVVLTSLVAGAIFAKQDFPLKNFLFALLLATAIVPFEAYILPLYATMVKWRWINTYQAMVLPYVVMAFGIFLMRQNIASSVPDELLDAARIDGCSEWQILVKIISPLSTGAMSALGIFAFIQAWTAFIWPLLIVTRDEMFNMELGLATFQRTFSVDYNILMAGSVITITPMIVVFILLRRRIVEGIALTGLKG